MRTLYRFFLLLLLLPHAAWAQVVTGDIEGWLLDEESRLAPSPATIIVAGPNLQATRSSVSMEDGYFRIKSLPVGVYTVTVQCAGYASISYEKVDVRLGRTTSLGNTLLTPQQAEPEVVVVTAQRSSLDFSSTMSGDNLSAEVLERLPTPRDYREVISYVSHANTSFLGDATNIAGSTGAENQYFIEGVNMTDAFFGNTGTRLPQNFVREVQVRKGGYEAEYGSATGGIVNVITHSGSNETRGQVFGFLTNNDIASGSRRGLGAFTQKDFNRYDFGASAGGAITKDKLWYFLAYNPTFQVENLEIPGSRFFEDKAVSHLFAGKLSWSVDPRTDLDLSVFGDPSTHDKVGGSFMISARPTQNPDPLLRDVTTGAIAASLSGRRFLGDSAIVEASLSRVEANNKEQPATEIGRQEPTYVDLINDTLSGGMQMRYDHHTVRWSTSMSTTIFAGSHELKLGVAYENLSLDEEWIVQTPDGRPGYGTRRDVDLWHTITLRNDFDVSHRLPSAYLQDSWRVTDRLRLNAGLRWDGIYIVNPQGEVAQSINDGYQPRAGFIYQLDAAGSRKLSGSYGRFYEQIPTIVSSWFFGDFYERDAWYDQNPFPDFGIEPFSTLVFDNSMALSDDLKAPYIDEFTLGYEQRLGGSWIAGIRGIYRDLGAALENRLTYPTWVPVVLGNPGQGLLDDMADPIRRYRALEFSIENTFGGRMQVAASYVLSELNGNFPGAYDQDGHNPHTHVSTQYWTTDQISEGLLPGDRTHVFKTYGSYGFDFGLDAGMFFTWQSGTPLSEYGGTWAGPNSVSHLVPRGTAGRTPSIWDANVRLAYDLSRPLGGPMGMRPRLLFDVFHLFGQRKPVMIDQVRYFQVDGQGNQTGVNPNYGTVTAYQPPMTLRIGIETSF